VLQAKKAVYPRFEPVPAQFQDQQQRVRQPRVVIPGKKALLFLMGALCCTLGLVVIAQYASIIGLRYQLNTSEAELGRVEEEHRKLEMETAYLSSLGRIDQIARNELGMREPDQSQIRILTASRR